VRECTCGAVRRPRVGDNIAVMSSSGRRVLSNVSMRVYGTACVCVRVCASGCACVCVCVRVCACVCVLLSGFLL
jgi:hypothetical protein